MTLNRVQMSSLTEILASGRFVRAENLTGNDCLARKGSAQFVCELEFGQTKLFVACG